MLHPTSSNLSSRQSLYARFKSLGLSLEKGERGKINASPEQVELLDELDEHLKKGGSLKSFLPSVDGVIVGSLESVEDESIMSGKQQLLEMLIGTVSEAMREALFASNLQHRSPLWYHEKLEKAAAGGWLLTSKEIKDLIGVKPYCKKGENVLIRGCWQLTKCGKIGGAST